MTSFRRIANKINPTHFSSTSLSLSKQNSKTIKTLAQSIDSVLKQVKQSEVIKTEVTTLPSNNELQGNTYFHEDIVTDIQNRYVKTVIFHYKDTIEIKLLFHFLSNSSRHNLDKYKDIMLSWLILLKTYETPNCVKSVEIDVYFTKFKKTLKSNSDDIIREGSNPPLSSYNVNTGFTWRCSSSFKGNGKIVIYREEDFLKVFFHETMHLFNMEFHDTCKESTKNIIRIASQLNLFESYCETWARLINIIYYSLYNPKQDFQTLLIVEGIYSLKQAIKVLDYYDLEIEDIHNNINKVGRLFVETSNVYSYYIVTSMLLTHPDNFLTYCQTFNINLLKFNKQHVYKYVKLLKSIITSKNLITMKHTLELGPNTTQREDKDQDESSIKMCYYDNN